MPIEQDIALEKRLLALERRQEANARLSEQLETELKALWQTFWSAASTTIGGYEVIKCPATIEGFVYDELGNPVPGITITIQDQTTGEIIDTVTTIDDGSFGKKNARMVLVYDLGQFTLFKSSDNDGFNDLLAHQVIHCGDNNVILRMTHSDYCVTTDYFIGVCNSNAVADDNFDIFLNDTKIGQHIGNQHACIGEFFRTNAAILYPPYYSNPADSVANVCCSLNYFGLDGSLFIVGPNILKFTNIHNNGFGNLFSVLVYALRDNGDGTFTTCEILSKTAPSFGFGQSTQITFTVSAPV